MKKKILPLAVAVLVMASSAVHADETKAKEDVQTQNTQDDDTPDYELDKLLVTAQRHETKELNTPATVTIITKEDIKAAGVKTVSDALQNSIGFSNWNYGPGGVDFGMSASRNILRGLERGTLILVNGAPINLLNYNGTGGIPIEAVERIEVIKGAASVLYGSEALSGVVNIITKKPAGDEKSGNIQAAIGNYQSKLFLSTQFGKSMLSIQRDLFRGVDDITRKSIVANNLNGRESSHLDSIYFATQFTDKLSFSAAFADNDNNYYLYFKSSGNRDRLYDYTDRRLNLNLTYNDAEKGLKSLLAFNNRRSRSDRFNYNSNGTITFTKNNEYYDLYNVTSDTQKLWNLGGENKLIAGVTIGTEHYSDPSLVTYTTVRNAVRNTIGLYLSHERHFSDKFSATLGLRTHYINDYAKTNTTFLPQIQTLYKIKDDTSWFINVGKSHQMPALNQYFNTSNFNPNPFEALKPQQGWTYETGVKIIHPKDSWKLSVYHMDIKDKFVWYGTKPDQWMGNGGDFKNTGVEVEYVKILNDNWNINLGASFSDPKINDSGSWVQDSSKVQTIAGVNYNKDKFSANLNYLFIGDRENSYYAMDGDGGVKKPIADRHTLNANFIYRPNKKNEITLSLYNILNRDNSISKYERLELPFNYVLNYSYKF